MVASKAKTVAAYLKELPAERRAVIAAVRAVILKNLPNGYDEAMDWGLISYQVPLRTHPETYNGRPLMGAGLAAQKNNYAVYLTDLHLEPKLLADLKDGFAKAGKKFDAGKSCVRFRQLEDLALPVVGKMIARVPPKALIDWYERGRGH